MHDAENNEVPMDGPSEVNLPRSLRPWSQEQALYWMIRGFLGWLFVYTVLQGPDGYFSTTVDRIDADWVKFTFLNIPLQILLTFVTAACAGSERPAVTKVGLAFGALNGVLVLVHIILSVATA